MECRLESSAERVSYLYLKRKKAQENDFITFAEMYAVDSTPSLSQTAPTDIRNRSPRLSGSTSSSNARLEARFYVNQMTCNDEATYQCLISYKPSGGDSRTENANASLSVTELPSQLTISASRINSIGGGYPQMIENRSAVDMNTDIELSCNGGIGRSSSTQIDWFWRQGRDSFFAPYSSPSDIIQESPTLSQCTYRRTSKLRHRMSTSDWQGVVFRCEVSVLTNTGNVRAYSSEFHVNPGYGFDGVNKGTSKTAKIEMVFLCLLVWLFRNLRWITQHWIT